MDIKSYDKYIVYFSGGKDSMACLLYLLDVGVPVEKIELWHHDIDGNRPAFMDWEVSIDYCRKVAATFNIPFYLSWKDGGFKKEMLREDSPTSPIFFETPEGLKSTGGNGPDNTRRKFPQVSADLSVRWCSSYLKIDVGAAAIRNQDRFNNIRTLTLSGERAQESVARSKYNIFDPDRADLRNGKKFTRLVDRFRPIHQWQEERVWEIIKKYKINPHPAYHLGWGRVSCKYCIFGSADQFASAYAISPKEGDEIITLEKDFGVTIKRKDSLPDVIAKGSVYVGMDKKMVEVATSEIYTEPIFVESWEYPKGAFGESTGPS